MRYINCSKEGQFFCHKMHTLPLNFVILQFCGMWRSLRWSSGWKIVIYHAYTITMLFSLYTLALLQFVDLLTSPDNVKEFINGSYMLLPILAACGKSVNIIKNREEIMSLTNVLRNNLCKPRNEDENKIQIDCERDTRFNTICYSFFTGISVLVAILRSLIVDIPRRQLFFKAWIPFDLDSSAIGFWLAYAHQIVGMNTAASINSSLDTLIPGLMMHTCAQLKILKNRIESIPLSVEGKNNICDENCRELRRNRQALESGLLTKCVEDHVRIFQFADSLNDIFGEIVFLQFALSSLVLCMSAYEISATVLFSAEFITKILFISCMAVQIFIYCFYGDELTHQSLDICDAVYRMDWPSLGITTKKSLTTLIARSQRPITFTCGHLITVSRHSFANLVKISYSVYNVLKQFSE